jgi:hypothetical protein
VIRLAIVRQTLGQRPQIGHSWNLLGFPTGHNSLQG